MKLTDTPLSVVAFAVNAGFCAPLFADLSSMGLKILTASAKTGAIRRDALKSADAVIVCADNIGPEFLRNIRRLADAGAPAIVVAAGCVVSPEQEMELLGAGVAEFAARADDDSSFAERVRRAIQRAMSRNRFGEKKKVDAQEWRASETQTVLNLFPIAVVIADEQGRVLVANIRARRLLDKRDGLFVDPKGQLRMAGKAENAILYDTIAKVHDGVDTDCALSATRASGDALSVLVVPVGRGGEDRKTGVTLFITDPGLPIDIAPATLEGLYGLTQAEARLVIGLVGGRTLEEIAEESGASPHTLRNHLKSAFRKAGVNRQAELVKLVLTGPAMFRKTPA